ncbi:MAG: hypothetical protein QOE77_1170 [Blastocatellia bacterium]|jgi:hypothetical protein|nr:hypothetical protein [Blastocatellia bacterium]
MAHKPGNKCEQSGIYKVNHDRVHKQEHEVTVVYGEPFPPCRGCGHGVTYSLVRGAIHIRSDDTFNH